MFAATMSPSYSPTWVSGQMPLTSPIAHSRSPARRYSSTRIPRGPASTTTVSRPIPCTRGRRPVATLLGAITELEHVLLAVAPRGGGVHAEHQLDAVPAQGLTEPLAERRGL